MSSLQKVTNNLCCALPNKFKDSMWIKMLFHYSFFSDCRTFKEKLSVSSGEFLKEEGKEKKEKRERGKRKKEKKRGKEFILEIGRLKVRDGSIIWTFYCLT